MKRHELFRYSQFSENIFIDLVSRPISEPYICYFKVDLRIKKRHKSLFKNKYKYEFDQYNMDDYNKCIKIADYLTQKYGISFFRREQEGYQSYNLTVFFEATITKEDSNRIALQLKKEKEETSKKRLEKLKANSEIFLKSQRLLDSAILKKVSTILCDNLRSIIQGYSKGSKITHTIQFSADIIAVGETLPVDYYTKEEKIIYLHDYGFKPLSPNDSSQKDSMLLALYQIAEHVIGSFKELELENIHIPENDYLIKIIFKIKTKEKEELKSLFD